MNKDFNKTQIFILVFLMILLVLTVADIKVRTDIKKVNEIKCESCMLYNLEAEYGLRGLYDPNSRFYCVWAANRSLTTQQRTEEHEICHDLVHQKEKHYCKGG